MNRYVIIVAGGSGTRLGADIPKQFLLLGGKPMLMHTIEAFADQVPEISIILVLPAQHIRYWSDLCKTYSFKIRHSVVAGGNFRGESVKNGLNSITTDKEALVAVHDGVRPFVDKKTIETGFNLAAVEGSAIPVCSIYDSLRIIDNGNNRPFDRDNLRSVQTPQCFRLSILRESYNRGGLINLSDDATLVGNYGYAVTLFDGNPENIKITNSFDLLIAEAIFIIRKTGKSDSAH